MTESTNKRSEPRLNRETTFFVETYSGTFDGSTETKVAICNSIDISANGIMLQMDDEIPVNSILRICADSHRQKKELYLVGEVKWTKKIEGHYNIGFELYDAENTDIAGWKSLIADIL